jgi:hypothetical protein
MNKDFTIIFEKLDEQAQVEAPEQQGSVVMLSGESLVELDELAELRRVVAEITEPEPLYFTTP